MIEYKVNQQKRVPIKRNSFFYDDVQLGFDVEMAKELLEQDMGQTVILFRVDISKTNKDELYGETSKDNINYLPPVEVPCSYHIDEAELRSYDKTKNLGVYQKMGKLKVGVMIATLVELDIDIKIGDIIGVRVDEAHIEYFQVENDGKNNYDNAHTLFGVKPITRHIICSPVEKSVFNG